MNADGTNRRLIRKAPADRSIFPRFSWSSDGRKIVFTATLPGAGERAVYYFTCTDVCGTNPNPGGGTNPGGDNSEPRLWVNTVRLTGTLASRNTYRLGEQIQATVTFNEAVTVTGTPQIGLTIGTRARQAVYDATQSKGTLVVFTYYVQATDVDADGLGIAANALTLNGGTITLVSDLATAAALAQAGVGTDDTRRVDGSTDVVEHGNSRE